jgi:ABC-2 type transport system ATP-binding protein
MSMSSLTATPLDAPDADDPDEMIRVDALTKIYPPDVRAVDNLTLTVGRGEIFGLLGPNGAGKSTTAGMLTTRVIPTRGSAHIAGIDVIAEPARAKRVIGVVPQTNTLDRSLSVFENLYFHGRFFGMTSKQSRAEATTLIDRIKLNRFSAAPVASLSGGMAQRLMLARAVMHRPAVLFLDEPTAGLDPQSRLALYEIVNELNSEGQTVLLTTHYMEEAEQLCGRIAIIDHGKILALDTPANLKRQVGADTIVTVTSEGDLDQLADVLRAGLATADAVNRVGDALQLAFAGTKGILPAIVGLADDAGFALRDLVVAQPTLETVFLTLTGRELRE